ncbi:hypothetical protein HMPREF1989_01950 [Porphyromonas gingivalis F0566]|nr:hypothetical protein HMPREF1989_01950 [Porphyromonas gingivalis F0566]
MTPPMQRPRQIPNSFDKKVRGNRKIISTQPLFIIKSGFQENPKI